MTDDFMKFIDRAAIAERQAATAAEITAAIESVDFFDEHLNAIISRITPRRREKLMGAWREFCDWAKARDLPTMPPVSAPIAAFSIHQEFAFDGDPKQAALRADAIRLLNDEMYFEAIVAYCRSMGGDGGGRAAVPHSGRNLPRAFAIGCKPVR